LWLFRVKDRKMEKNNNKVRKEENVKLAKEEEF
jgi:hypothetical protein